MSRRLRANRRKVNGKNEVIRGEIRREEIVDGKVVGRRIKLLISYLTRYESRYSFGNENV